MNIHYNELAILLLSKYLKDLKQDTREILAHPYSMQHYFHCQTKNQPRHPSNAEQVKKMWHKYIMSFYSGIRNEIMSFHRRLMQLEESY